MDLLTLALPGMHSIKMQRRADVDGRPQLGDNAAFAVRVVSYGPRSWTVEGMPRFLVEVIVREPGEAPPSRCVLSILTCKPTTQSLETP